MTTIALATRRGTWTRFFGEQLYASGAGYEVATVDRRVRELEDELAESLVITYREAVLADTVKMLANMWRAETKFESSLTRVTGHPAYRAIVDLGAEVVPILLDQLRQRPEPWFAALREITGEDPVQPTQRGDMRLMADAWVRWGRERRLIR